MKSTSILVASLLLVAGTGAWFALTGGFTKDAETPVGPGSRARVGSVPNAEAADLAPFARDDGRTVFFFTKPWCGGCWRLAPRVEEAVRRTEDAWLRVVDIGSWESAVARRHGIDVTPILVLFEDGREVARGTAEVLRRIEGAEAEGTSGGREP